MIGILFVWLHGRKIELDFAILEIVQNLICGTFATVFERQQFLHIVDVEV
jgi:hypothetical protein